MRNFLWSEYAPILTYLVVGVLLSVALLTASWILASQRSDVEKLSAYECGFAPFDDARKRFDVKYYLVAILFIVFDLEVSFLFPWGIVLGELPVLGWWSMYLFLIILTAGFLYEWRMGAMEWH